MAKDTESFVPWCKGFRTLFYVERQSFALSALKVKGWGLWPTPEPFLCRIYLEVDAAAFPVGVSQSLRALPPKEQTPRGDEPPGPCP